MPTDLSSDLQKIQSELVRAIRGKLSASALSAKLGYKFNQVSRWEKGERRLLWTDFVAICEAKRLPLREQLDSYLGYRGDLSATGPFTKTLLSGKSIDETSKTTQLNRSKISRWLNGKAPPTFADVFLLLRSTINVISFLERLVDLSKVPSLAEEYDIFRKQRELAYAMPYFDALMEALLVRSYQEARENDLEILAAVAGLPVGTVASALEKLFEAGMVEKNEGKYKSIEINIDHRADKVQMVNLMLHWLNEITRIAGKLRERPLDGSLIGFSVFSLSKEGHERALNAFREFHRTIHEIGSLDKGPKEKVLVLANGLVDVAHFGQRPEH